MAACLTLILLSLILPAAACVFVSLRLRTARPVLLGAACFFVFQACTRLPLLRYALPLSADYLVFQLSSPVLYILLLSLSAGVFEEGGRYLLLRGFMRDCPRAWALAFGLGHGALESVLLVGVNALALLLGSGGPLAAYPAGDFLLAGLERVFVITAHMGLSVMVWRGVRYGRLWLLLCAVALHALLDFSAAYLSRLGVNLWLIEALLAAYAAALMLYTFKGKDGVL